MCINMKAQVKITADTKNTTVKTRKSASDKEINFSNMRLAITINLYHAVDINQVCFVVYLESIFPIKARANHQGQYHKIGWTQLHASCPLED